jgi:autotransporter-associated beta strand protein
MRCLRAFRRSIGLMLMVLMLTWQIGQPLHAATLYWDADTQAFGDNITGQNLGGSGTWNTTNTNWWDGSSSTDTIAAFGSGDTAVFGGLGGIVLLNSAFSLGGITFNQTPAGSTFNITGDGTTATQLTLQGTGAAAGSLAVNVAGTDTISAIIAGTNGLNYSSTTTGTLLLSGANTFSGTINISSGTLAAFTDANLGATTNGITFNGSAAAGLTLNMPSVLNASRTITLSNTGGSVASLSSTGAAAQVVLGQVTGAGTFAIANAGTTYLLNSTNNTTGILWAQSGLVSLNVLSDASGNGNVKLGSGTTTGGIQWGTQVSAPLVLTNRSIELAGTTGGGTIDSSALSAANFITINNLIFTTPSSGAKTLTLTGVNTGTNTITANVTDNVTSSATSLTKSGLSQWVLTGSANTYSGTLTINQGTLKVVNASGLGGSGSLSFGTASNGQGIDIRSDVAPTSVRNITNNNATNAFIFLDHAAVGGNTTTGQTLTLGTVTQVNSTAAITFVGDHGYGVTIGVNTLNHNATAATNSTYGFINDLGSPDLTGYTTGSAEVVTINGFTTDASANTGGVTQTLSGWGNYTIGGTISSPVASNGLPLNITKNGIGLMTYAPTTLSGWTAGTLTLSAGTTRVTSSIATGGATVTMSGGLLELRNDASTNFGFNIAGVTAASTLVLDHSIGGTTSGQTATIGTLTIGASNTLNIVGDHGYGLTTGNVSIGAFTLTLGNYLNAAGYSASGYTPGIVTLGNVTSTGAAVLTLNGYGDYTLGTLGVTSGSLTVNKGNLGIVTIGSSNIPGSNTWTSGTINTTLGTTRIDASVASIGAAAIGVAGGITEVRSNSSTAWSSNNLTLQTASGTLVAAPAIGSSNTGNVLTLGSLTSGTTGLTFSFDTNHNYGITLSGAATSAIAATTINNIGNGTVTFAGGLTNTAATVWTLGGNGDFAVTGNLLAGTATTGLTKAGFGTLTLSGAANTFTGALTLTGGILKITTSLGTGTGALTFNNTASGLPNNNVIGLDLRNNSSMDLSTHPLGRSINTVFNADNNGSGTNGTITLGTGLSLQDNGYADLFMGANGYSIKFGSGAAAKVAVAAGAIAYTLWNYIPSVSGNGNVEFAGGLAFQNTASTGQLTFGGTGDYVISGAITGTVADTLTKSGLGTVTLSADSSAGWNTSTANNIYTMTNGITRATVAGALGGANAKVNVNSGVLDLRASTGFTLTAPITVGASNSYINVDAAVGSTGTLGSNTQTLSGVSLGAFTLFATGGGSTAGNIYSLNTGVLTMTGGGTIINNIGNAGTLTATSIGGTQATVFSGAGSTIISGTAASSLGTITKTGTGTVTFQESAAGANTTGNLTINAGTLSADYGTGVTNTIFTATDTVAFGGGTFQVKGATAGTATSQTLGNLTVNAGGGTINIVPQGGGTTTLTTGTLTATATGGTFLFSTADATKGILKLNTALNTATTLSGRAVIFDSVTATGSSNYNWLANTGANTNSIAYASYNDVAGATLVGNTLNDRISSTTASQVTTGATVATNSLMINAQAASQSLSLGSTILTLTNGGLLFTGSNAYSITGTSTGGLKSGIATTSDFIINNYGSSALTISAPIVHNAGTDTLTVGGTGTTIMGNSTLAAIGSYTGLTYVNGGTLKLASGTSSLGATTSTGLTINGGTLDVNGNSLGLGAVTGGYAGTIDNSGTATTLTVGNGNATVSILGTIKNTGSALSITKTGTGLLTLGDVNGMSSMAFTGDLTINTQAAAGANVMNLAVPLADTSGAKINLGTANAADTIQITYVGATNMVLNNRQFDLSGQSNVTINGTGVNGPNGTAGMLVINSNLLTDGSGAKTLTLGGTTGALSPGGAAVSGISGSGSVVTINQFNGNIGNANGGGALTLTIAGSGGWSLGGNNNFNGGVNITSTGVIRGTSANAFGGSANTINWNAAGQLDLRSDSSLNFGNPISWGNAALKINVDRAAVNGTGYGQVMTLGAITETVTGQTLTVTNAVGVGSNLNGSNPIGGYGLRVAGLVLNAGTATTISNGIDGASTAQFAVPASGTGVAGAFTIDGITTAASLGTHTLTIGSAGNSDSVTIITGDIVQNTGTTLNLVYTGNNLLTLSGQTSSTNYNSLTISPAAAAAATVRATTQYSLGTGTITFNTANAGTLEIRSDSSINFGNPITLANTTAATDKLQVGEAINGTGGHANTFTFGALNLGGITANALTVSGISGSNNNSNDSVTFGNVTLGNGLNGTTTFTVNNNLTMPGMMTLGNVTSSNTNTGTTQTLAIGGTGVTTIGNVTDSSTSGALTALTYSGTGILDLSKVTSANTYTGGLTLTGGTTRVTNQYGLGANTGTQATSNTVILNAGTLEMRGDVTGAATTFSNQFQLKASSTLNLGELPGGSGVNGATGVSFSLGQLKTVTTGLSLTVNGIGGSLASSSDSATFSNGVDLNGLAATTITNNLPLPGMLNLGNVTSSASVATALLTIGGAGVTTVGDVTNGSATAVALTYTGSGILDLSRMTAATNYSGGFTLNGTGTARVTNPLQLGAASGVSLSGGTLEIRSDSNFTYSNPVNWNGNTGNVNISIGEVGTGTTTGVGSTFSFGALTITTASGKTLSFGGIGNTGASSSDSVTVSGVTFGAGNLSNTISNNLALPGTLSLGNITGNGTTGTVTMTIGGSGFTTIGDVSNGSGGSITALTYNGTGILQVNGTGASNFSGGLNMAGAGILRMMGANSFGTNNTQTIALTGSASALGTFEIRTDANLSILNPVTVSTNSVAINVDAATAGNISQTVTFAGATTTLSITGKTLTLNSGSNYGMTFTNGFNETTTGAAQAYGITNNASGTVNLGAINFANTTTSNTLTLGGTGYTTVGNLTGLAPSNILAYSGTGFLDLTGNNASSNQITAVTLSGAGGIVKVNTPTNLGAANDLVSFTTTANSTLQVRNDGTGSNGTIAFGNGVALNVAAAIATIDVGNNTANTGNTIAFGALTNNTTAQASGTLTVNGANGYGVSFTSMALPNGTGATTTLIANATVTISGAVTQAITPVAAHYDTLVLDGVRGGSIGGIISDSSTGGVSVGNGDTRITKNGVGTWTLGGANTYVGPTTVNAGTLLINGSTSATSAVTVNGSATLGTQGTLGGTGTIGGSVTLATNSATSFNLGPAINPATAGVIGTLTINGALTTNNFSKLNFDITSGGSGDLISTATLPVIGGNTQLNFNTLGTLTVGSTYTLISGYSGTIAGAASIGAFTGLDTTHTGVLVNNNGSLQLMIGGATPSVAYWSGAIDGNWNTLTVGTAASNWRTDANSNVDTNAAPGATTDVHFVTTNPTAGNLTTTLGQNLTIQTLSFDTTSTSAVTINSGSTLTITPSSSATGISLNANAGAVTINSGVALGAAQTWTNNSTVNQLTVTGNVANGGNTLTIAGPAGGSGTGGTTVTGIISGTGGLAVTSGTLNINQQANTFTGNVTVDGASSVLSIVGNSAGTYTTSNPLGTLGGGIFKTVTLTNGGTFSLASLNYNDNAVSTTNIGAGQVFMIGTGGGTFNVASGSLLTLDDGSGAGTASTNAELQGTGDLTKTGQGTLALGNGVSNFSAFTGNIFIKDGILKTGDATAIFSNITLGSATTNGTLDINSYGSTISGLYVAAGATASSQIVGNSSTTAGGVLNLNVSGTDLFSGVIQNVVGAGTKTTGIAMIGTGSLVLTGANTYTGPTNVQNGSIQLAGGDNRLGAGSAVTLGNGAVSAKLIIGGDATGAPGTDPTAGNQHSLTLSQTSATSSLAISGTGTANSVIGGAAGGTSAGTPVNNSVLTLNIGAGFTDTYAGLIGWDGTGSVGFQNNINLVKSGGGTLVLSTDLSKWTGTMSDAGANMTNTTTDPTRPELDLTGGVLRLTSTAVINTVIRNTGGVIDDLGATYGSNYFLIVSGGLIAFSQSTDNFSNSGLTSTSHGVGALNIAGNNAITDYTGSDMYLGAIGARVFSNSPLAVGSGSTYRFGGGAPWQTLGAAAVGGSGGYLQVSTANVVTGINNVIIGDNGSYNGSSGLFGSNSTVEFTAAQNFDGTITLAGGSLVVSNANQLGTLSTTPTTGSIILDGGILRYSGITTDFSNRLTIASGGTIDTNGQNVTFATALANSNTGTSGLSNGGLTKIGAGTLTLNKVNTYAGATTVNQGALTLDLNTAAADNVAPNTSLVLAGGSLNVIGSGSTTARTQSFTTGGTSFVSGSSTITPTLSAAGTGTPNLTIAFGALSRSSGATGNIVFTTGNTTATNTLLTQTGIATTNTLITDANGVAYLTFGTTATAIDNWAVTDATTASKIISAPASGFYTAATATTISGNADIGAQSPTVTGSAGDNAITSIRFDNAGARTLTLNQTGASTFSVGGILVGAAVGSNATTIAGTAVLQGPSLGAGDLVIFNWDTSSSLTISEPIGGAGLTKSGTGALILSGTNTYSGQTVINGGSLSVSATANLGNTTGITLNGGTFANTGTVNIAKIFTLGLNGGTINITAAGNQSVGTAGDLLNFLGLGSRTLTLNTVVDRKQTFNFSIGDNGGPTNLSIAGAGDTSYMVLNATNTYTGTTTISRGILQLATATALPGGLGGATLSSANTGGGNLTFSATGTNRAILELTAASGGFYRALGTGFDQVQWTGNGGFSNATTGAIVVNLGAAGATVTWGSGSFVPTGNILQFGQAAANSLTSGGSIDFQNPINLGGAVRTIDVSNGVSNNSTGVDAILSGALTGATGGGLTKTGAGVLKLTANNAAGTAASSATTVSGGFLVLANSGVSDLSALPGSGSTNRTLTINAGGAVVLTGQSDPTNLLARTVLTSAGGVALDTSSSVTIDLSAFSSLGLGAYSDIGGTPVYFNGTILPNSNTYRFSSETQSGAAAGPVATSVQAAVSILVLNRTNLLTDNGGTARSVNFGAGEFYLPFYNTYTGTTVINSTAGGSSQIGIGNDSAFNTGAISASPTTASSAYFGALNGDHFLSNNINLGVAGNLVIAGNTASRGIANYGAMTYLSTINLPATVSLYAEGLADAVILGDLKPTGATTAITFNNNNGGLYSLLTTPNGAVAKTFTSTAGMADTSTFVIDSDRSFGAVPASVSTNLTIGTDTFEILPGMTSAITLSSNRNIAITATKIPVFNTPGDAISITGVTAGGLYGNSSLIIPGALSGATTGGLTKTGLGTLTLSNASATAFTTGAGKLNIFAGTLVLDGATAAANFFSGMTAGSSIPLVLGSTSGVFGGGGTLQITGTTSQFLGSSTGASAVTVNPRSNTINLTGTMQLTLGAITRTTGSYLNFAVPSGTVASTTAAVAGLVNGATTWNGNDWAAASGSAISQYTAYTALTGTSSAATITSSAAANYLIDSTTTNNVTLAAVGTLAAPNQINTLKFSDTNARTLSLGSGFLELGTGGAAGGGVTNAGGILVASGSGALTISGGSIMAGGTTTNTLGDLVLINNSSNPLTISSVIVPNNGTTGTTPVVINGTGRVVLSGANTFTGGIFINSGVLEYTDGSAVAKNLGSPTAGATNINLNGGAIRYTGSTSNNLIFGATVNSFSAFDVPNAAGTVVQTAQGMLGIGGVAGILQKTGAGALTLNGTTTDTNLSVEVVGGTFNLAKTSSSTVWSVDQTGGGAALIVDNAAKAVLGGTGGNQISDTSSVLVKTGGTLDLNGTSEGFDGLAGGGVVTNNATGTSTLTIGTNQDSNISANTLFAAAAGVTSTGLNNFSGVIQDGGSGKIVALTKAGAGTQILSGVSTYSGATTINSGTLKFGIANALPSGSGKGNVTIVGNTVVNALTVAGTFDLSGYNQAINGLNSSTGGYVVNTPTLSNNGTAWGTNAGSGSTFSTSATTATNTLTVGNNNATGSFNGILQDGLTIIPVAGTGAGTAVTGKLAFTKVGTGTQTLSGINTYSGTTTIQSVTGSPGTLALSSSVVNNNIALSPTIVVGDVSGNSGAVLDVTGITASGGFQLQGTAVAYTSAAQTLTGFGTVNGAVTALTGSTINAGAVGTVGTLNFGSTLTFNSGSTLVVDVGAGANNADKLAIVGAATITSGANLSFNVLSTLDQGKYVLATAASGLNSAAFTATAPTNYRLLATATELDLTHKADQSFTTSSPGASVNAFVNTSISLSGSLTNTAIANSSALVVGLASTGTLTVDTFPPSNGSTVAVGSPQSVTGTIHTSGTAGSGLGWQVTNTDSNAVTTSASISGTVNVFLHGTPTKTADLTFATVHTGATLSSQSVTISNGTFGSPAANAAGITWTAGALSGGITGGGSASGSVVASGGGSSYNYGINTATAGNKSGSQVFTFADDTSILGNGSLGTLTVNASSIVYSGQAIWAMSTGGSWGSSSAAATNGNWTSDGNALAGNSSNAALPGVDGSLSAGDTATFGNAIGSTSQTITLDAATPSLAGITFNNNQGGSYTLAAGSGSNSVNLQSGATITDTNGSHTISAGVAMGSSNTVGVSVANSGDTLTVSGVVSGSGSSITKTGAGALALTNTNTYSGQTNINGGTVSVSASANLGDGSATNTIAMAGGTLQSTGTFDAGTNRTVALGTGGGTVDVTGTNALTLSGTISGSTGLAKTDSGTLIVTANNNSFSGNVTVSGGKLEVDNTPVLSSDSGTGSGTVTVGAGRLTGSGTVSSTILNSGAVLAPGVGADTALNNSNQTLTFTSVVGNAGSRIELGISAPTVQAAGLYNLGFYGNPANNESTALAYLQGSGSSNLATWNTTTPATTLGQQNYDFLKINGSLSLVSGTAGIITVLDRGYTAAGAQIGDVFKLIDWSGTLSGGFSASGTDIALPDLSASSLSWDTSAFTTYGILVVVPEPSRALFLMLGLFAFCYRRRRAVGQKS